MKDVVCFRDAGSRLALTEEMIKACLSAQAPDRL